MNKTGTKPRILIYDIETSYIVGGTWGIWQSDVVTVLQDWQILCFSYKWLGERTIHSVALPDFRGYRPGTFKMNDYQVVKRLHELFSEADIVIAHNGNSFDQKKAQARMLIHGFNPPTPYQQIDTKRAVKKVAAPSSSKLSELAKALEITHKTEAGGIATWTGCMEGDPKAWRKMILYNKRDVKVLEELYLKIRGWIDNHPSVARIADRPDVCPNCGRDKFESKGFRVTKTQKYRRFMCTYCGRHVSWRTAEKDTKPIYV